MLLRTLFLQLDVNSLVYLVSDNNVAVMPDNGAFSSWKLRGGGHYKVPQNLFPYNFQYVYQFAVSN
jgi:hypothetical protein